MGASLLANHGIRDQARSHNLGQDLTNVRIAGLDEIFQQGRPVFVGADIARKEHDQIVTSLDVIDHLPPGLYEMKVVLKDGRIDQVELNLAGTTPVGKVVRSMKLGTQSEGCVVC